MCVYVFVCVRESVRERANLCASLYVCVCVSVRESGREHLLMKKPENLYEQLSFFRRRRVEKYFLLLNTRYECVCVCVCVYVCVCVCVCVSIFVYVDDVVSI